MRILFDQGTPVPLRALLTIHDVATVYELGWSRLNNGELLKKTGDTGYEALHVAACIDELQAGGYIEIDIP
ncbi:MAG TPA: hypothetical protein VMH77_07710 [Steroidobacteraceae bacterium]|nr:hypothetical protein [Steroidobacteraceae bacterium]